MADNVVTIKLEVEKGSTKKTAETFAEGLTQALQKSVGKLGFGGMGNKKGKEGGDAISSGVLGGIIGSGIAGGIFALVSIFKDFPIVTATMKLLKLLLLILLLPLVPILKPLLLGLAAFVKSSSKGAKNGLIGAGGLGLLALLGLGSFIGAGTAQMKEEEKKTAPGVNEERPKTNIWEWITSNILNPAAEFFKTSIEASYYALFIAPWVILKDVGLWIWNQIIRPSWNFLKDVGKWIWNWIIYPSFNFLKDIGVWIWNIIKSPFEWLAEKIRSIIEFFGGGSSKSKNVKDAIITPSGVVNTDPNDYIIATKNPQSLGKGGGSPTFNVTINNPSVRNDEDIKKLVREIQRIQQVEMRRYNSYV